MEKNYVIYNCELIRKVIRKEDNKYGGCSVEMCVYVCEKQFCLGLLKGMEDFFFFLRVGLMMFQQKDEKCFKSVCSFVIYYFNGRDNFIGWEWEIEG